MSREHGVSCKGPAGSVSAVGALQRGGEYCQGTQEKAGDQEEVLRQDMKKREQEDVRACSHPDEPAAKAYGEALVPENEWRKGAETAAQQCREHEKKQHEIREKRGEKSFAGSRFGVVIPVSSSAERASVFLVERQVLKNRPVNRPVRKMNNRMDPIFRMVKSPFNMWFDTRICSLSF